MTERTRILLLHTGGTIGMVPTTRGLTPGAGVVEAAIDRLGNDRGDDLSIEIVRLDPLIDSANAAAAVEGQLPMSNAGAATAMFDTSLATNAAAEAGYYDSAVPSEPEKKETEGRLALIREALRQIRRSANDALKKAQKNSDITEDDLHRSNDTVQKKTDDAIKRAEGIAKKKEEEILGG